MSQYTGKDFGLIESDYDFFIGYSDEDAAALRAYGQTLKDFRVADGPLRFLDFGCGAGDFSEKFLDQAKWPAAALEITLLEPVAAQRQQAAEALAHFSRTPITQLSALPQNAIGDYNIILANHVFYYVENLEETVIALRAALRPAGLLLVAMNGNEDPLNGIQRVGFDAIGLAFPYHVRQELEVILARLDWGHEQIAFPYCLAFPDSQKNRMKILRFLLANHLAEMPLDLLLAQFDDWRQGSDIVMDNLSHHTIIRG